jgi:hypothetical protein
MALIDRLAEALAAIYLEFDLFYSFDSNRLIMKHIVDLAKDVGSLDASPQSCTDGYYGYYGLHTFQLYCKYIDWLLKRSK